jgi:hypothetical protein
LPGYRCQRLPEATRRPTSTTNLPTKEPTLSDQHIDTKSAQHINRVAFWMWLFVALVYVLLAVYTAWFSVDKDMLQATTWFALAVVFFCIGLIPNEPVTRKPSARAGANKNPPEEHD